MILNISGRTDIVAFYTPWLVNRLKSGYVDVRNPFNKSLVSRIYFKDVDIYLFCTKNPIPIIPYLKLFKNPIIFHVTLTPYKKDIEVNVKDKKKLLEAIKEISLIVGVDNIYIRYDPIFINKKYTIDYHIKAFKKICESLNGYVKHIIVSFLDNYKNVEKNIYEIRPKHLEDIDYEKIGKSFSKIALQNDISVQTCNEEKDLTMYGFKKSDCMTKELAYALTGKNFSLWKARKGICNCVSLVDIGVYNTCLHLCKYCYANFNESSIKKNICNHDINSSLLIGHLENDDKIVVRKE